MSIPSDVLVVGGGPAGLAAAVACSVAGISTTLLAPDPMAVWPAGYGLWPDDLMDPKLAACISVAWDAVSVRFGPGDAHCVQRRYARVDNSALQHELLSRASGLRFARAAAIAVAHDAAGSTVQLDDGRALRAAVVVDATGPTSALVRRNGQATAFQAAWGEVVDTDDLDPSAPRWMDFTPVAGRKAAPTFLYALPLGGSRWLLEETSLVGRPAMGADALRHRLHARLAAEGIRVGAPHAVERVLIPLDTAIPRPQRVVAFGAAAGMVHPSTGYLLSRVLNAAPVLAAALAHGLDGGTPEATAHAARAALWPADRVRRRALHRYGADVVAGLDQGETVAFFRAFFERLPPRIVRDWLADALPARSLLAAMARLFPGLPTRLKWKAASGPVRHLVAAALT